MIKKLNLLSLITLSFIHVSTFAFEESQGETLQETFRCSLVVRDSLMNRNSPPRIDIKDRVVTLSKSMNRYDLQTIFSSEELSREVGAKIQIMGSLYGKVSGQPRKLNLGIFQLQAPDSKRLITSKNHWFAPKDSTNSGLYAQPISETIFNFEKNQN
ncbi:MAG: hypothetical protein KDD34_01050 [Bdellovibrionales bacterium]|nr:hypothetical protein [Bdellovibrionales bacterium]